MKISWSASLIQLVVLVSLVQCIGGFKMVPGGVYLLMRYPAYAIEMFSHEDREALGG